MNENEAFKVDIKQIENLKIDPILDKFFDFTTLMAAIYRKFEALDDELCTEDEIKTYVQEILSDIQPYL